MLLSAISGSLVGRFGIRRGLPADIDVCDRIARGREKLAAGSLGWVRRDSLERAIAAGLLHVGEIDGTVRGFVLFSSPERGASKGWNVVHTLAVQAGWDGFGIGRNLLYSVPCPVRLKCPVVVGDGCPNPANKFYASAGMRLASVDVARSGRLLNVWERHFLTIFVAGGNVRFAEVARSTGWAYGTRQDKEPASYPLQVDLVFDEDWHAFDWSSYIVDVRRWRPVSAMALDYFEPAQREVMLSQVADLRAAGVLRPMVCPKFDGAVADIPSDCIVALSVPSRYSGWLPADFRELSGRRLHLLGGSPRQWLDLVPKLQAFGARVISVDGNSQEAAAKRGSQWASGRWVRPPQKADYQRSLLVSGREIARQLDTLGDVVQLPLWGSGA